MKPTIEIFGQVHEITAQSHIDIGQYDEIFAYVDSIGDDEFVRDTTSYTFTLIPKDSTSFLPKIYNLWEGTVYDLEKGAKIFPDAAKVDIDNIIGNSNRKIIIKNEDDKLLKEIRMTNTLLKRQKSANFYGMPLIEQMNSKEKINKRKRGLL